MTHSMMQTSLSSNTTRSAILQLVILLSVVFMSIQEEDAYSEQGFINDEDLGNNITFGLQREIMRTVSKLSRRAVHRKSLEFSPNSTTIKNNERWYDDQDVEIKANRCGTISRGKINGYWYMVGSESSHKFGSVRKISKKKTGYIEDINNINHGGDIWIYRSEELGSNSWERVKRLRYYEVGGGESRSSNCGIHQKGDSDKVLVICRRKIFISHNGPEGDYTELPPLDIPESYPERGAMKVGGSSTYEEDGDLYFISSRVEKDVPAPRNRYTYIYKLNSEWTGLSKDNEGIVVSWLWNHRESPSIAKKDGFYYVFVSQTKGWKQSRTFYKRSKSMVSLPDAAEQEVVMHPANTKSMQSMDSQFCFFQEFGDGKWMFGGRRHPEEAPEYFSLDHGKHVMVPANFEEGVPHVYWKLEFDWSSYDYTSGNFDPY